MDRFLGRKEELALLEHTYCGSALRTCSIRGRRRIGKSRLIEEFCKDRPSIMMSFEESGARRNLDIMGKAVSVFCGKDMRFEDLDGAFAELGRICKEQRVVISFDEYPYLAESISDVSAKLKGFIDDAIDHSESMMIICGSSISAMKSELDDSSKPLYGRFTLSLDLKPMTFGECREFHPGMSDEDMLMLYLTLGGSPMYHSMADKSTYRECIESLFLGRLPQLGDELDSIVRREFKPAWKHSAVLDAIGYRQATLADISSGTGLEPPMCLTYLKNLMAADIVEIVEPMLGAPKGPTYRISDDLVAFGTSVMLNGATRMSDTSTAYNEIYPDLRTFLGARFERFCETFIGEHYFCRSVGKWWGKANGEDTDIDVVAEVSQDRISYTVVAECKFTAKPMGFGALNRLRGRIGKRCDGRNLRIMLMSVSGFDDDLRDYAEEQGIILIDLDVLVGNSPAPRLRSGPDPAI